MIRRLVLTLKLWDLPRFLELIGRDGERKFYKVSPSRKQLGIALHAVEPEQDKMLRRQHGDR